MYTQDAFLLFTVQLLVTAFINPIYILLTLPPPLHKFTDSPVCVLKNDGVFLLPAGVAAWGDGCAGLGVLVVCEEMIRRKGGLEASYKGSSDPLLGTGTGVMAAPTTPPVRLRNSWKSSCQSQLMSVSSSCGWGHRGPSGVL